jgi:hypothetical protein
VQRTVNEMISGSDDQVDKSHPVEFRELGPLGRLAPT